MKKPMDDADRYGIIEERAMADLNRRIAASRGIPARAPKIHHECLDCGIDLEYPRRILGICWECAEVREARARLGL